MPEIHIYHFATSLVLPLCLFAVITRFFPLTDLPVFQTLWENRRINQPGQTFTALIWQSQIKIARHNYAYFLVSCLLISKPPFKSPPLIDVLLIILTVSFFILSCPLSVRDTLLLLVSFECYITVRMRVEMRDIKSHACFIYHQCSFGLCQNSGFILSRLNEPPHLAHLMQSNTAALLYIYHRYEWCFNVIFSPWKPNKNSLLV